MRDSYKVTDFDVTNWRPGLRECYERTAAASAAAETVLAGDGGGGDWRQALKLSNATLDALESAGGEAAENILVMFLWAWAEILGLKPELDDYKLEKHYPKALSWLESGSGDLFQAKKLCTDLLGAAFGRRLSSWNL
ncbi:MAG: hypothetical protein Pg6A_20590 [Termitinemataceae bacterium]|nr:MAG: hypothetical protein Pg6A_20590 [Termitinemataceae bacterium]